MGLTYAERLARDHYDVNALASQTRAYGEAIYGGDIAANNYSLSQAIAGNEYERLSSGAKLAAQKQTSELDIGKAKLGVTQAERGYALDEKGNRLQQGVDQIDVDAAKRQQGYINDMLAYTNQDIGARDAIQNLDMGQMERQFPLLASARQDIEVKVGLLRADLARVDVKNIKDERMKQLDLYIQATANGSIHGAEGQARANDAAEDLRLEIENNDANRQRGELEYQAALRDNTEKQAQARDAIEKIKLEKERLRIERERAARQAEEARQKAADDLKKAQYQQYFTALQLQKDQEALQRARENAYFEIVAAQQRAQQAAYFNAIEQQRREQANWDAMAQHAAQAQATEAKRQQDEAAYIALLQSQQGNRTAGPTTGVWMQNPNGSRPLAHENR
jgi:hypothetical protein